MRTAAWRSLAVTAALGLISVGLAGAGATTAHAKGCPTAVFFGVRGTDEKEQGQDQYGGYGQTINQVRTVLDAAVTDLPYYPVVVDEHITYPALLFPTQKVPTGYGGSKTAGIKELGARMKYWDTMCSGEPFVLAGYSEGADVVLDAYNSSPYTKQIISVAALGDPYFNPLNKDENAGSYEGYFGFAGGPFGSLARHYPKTAANHVLSLCAKGDWICNLTPLNFATCYPPPTHPNCSHYNYWNLQYKHLPYTSFAASWLLGGIKSLLT
jgi:hypothetical protein